MKLMNRSLLYAVFFTISMFFACGGSDDNVVESKEQEEVLTVLATKEPEKTMVFSDVILGGIITEGNDDFVITERGVSFSETMNPTTTDSKEISNSSTKDFSVTISNLKSNTLYYFKAYAFDGSKTIYGDEKQITTDLEPLTGVNAFLPTAGTDKSWVIQPTFTNEFDYADGKASSEFTDNWQDRFFNGWTGPKKSGAATTSTIYTAGNSSITGGELVYKATIDGNNVHTGIVTSKEKVGYPLYMEARVKISESSLASAVWMLSEDSTQEIDNLEAYGDKTQNYYNKRLHLSHHTFIRNPFQDYQPKGNDTYYVDENNTLWADDYHNYGVLWLDPWTLKYYVDGKLVRETPTNQIDPENYTEGTGLNKDMYLIISAAAQPWRENLNQVDDYTTDPSVVSEARSTMRINYIRTYKPE